MQNLFIRAAGISGAIAIAFGALGAHALKSQLSPEMLQAFETGVRYQIYHSIGLLCVALLMQFNSGKLLKGAGVLFITGIFLFSGSLYFLSTRSLTNLEGGNWVGIITPLGGLSFITGWLFLTFAFLNPKK